MNDASPAAPPAMLQPIRNPILRGFYPDPSILRVGSDYYIATSTFEWYPGVQILHSTDLGSWTLAARPLDEERLLDLAGVPDSCGIWAPCLSWADGRFWLCYTVVRRFDGNFKDAHNFLTTATAVDGEWSDPVYINSSGFDPSLYHDDDGRKWHLNMLWDHRHGRPRFGGIVLQEYSPQERRLVGEADVIFHGSERGMTEGPHVYKRAGYYYLMTAEGGTGYEHAVTLARSRSIHGPYEIDPESHIMSATRSPAGGLQRTGHASLVETPGGDWYLAHLCSRPLDPANRRSPMGRETALQRVYWDEAGWLRLAEPERAYVASTDHAWLDVRYDFDGGELPNDFQWLRIPDSSRLFSTTDRPGYLRLFGRESIGSLYESSLVARRQQHFNYVAETCVDFLPDTFQQMAGLVAYYNGHKFHYLYVTRGDNGGREVGVMSCPGDPSLELVFPAADERHVVAGDGPVHLRCTVEGAALQFAWSADGERWTGVGPALDAGILSDEAGKTEHGSFTGAFVGMACQDVSGRARCADFDYFTYREFE